MTSTRYGIGSKYSYAELMQSAYAVSWTNEEAEEIATRVIQITEELLPYKLFWQPHTSELILFDIDDPLTQEEDSFDFDAILNSAFCMAIEETYK